MSSLQMSYPSIGCFSPSGIGIALASYNLQHLISSLAVQSSFAVVVLTIQFVFLFRILQGYKLNDIAKTN